MAEILVREWLVDSKVQSPSELQNVYYTLQNNELVQGIFTVLEDRPKTHEILEGICNQLFGFYRSTNVELRRFTLQYLPAMACSYLCSLAQGDKKAVKCVEVFLLGIYNLEVVDNAGKPKVLSFRLPFVSKPSIYHMPLSLTSAALTENSVLRLEKGDNQHVSFGPFPQEENLNAHNRMKVLRVLMNVYNRNLSFMPKHALHSLCKVSSRLTKQGFGKQHNHHRSSFGSDSVFGGQYSKPPSRIPLTSSFLLEILHGVYFSMNNGLGAIGMQALDDIYYRASHELMADVLLVVNAIRNSLHSVSSGHPGDGPMGINISISPTTSMTTVSKSAVTNASFRTRKLPDDIPIQTSSEEPNEVASLATISEEMEDGDRGQQNVKLKDGKEKGKGQLINKISKIGGGGKSKDKTDKVVPFAPPINSSASSNHPTNGIDSRRKESDPSQMIGLLKTGRKESDSSSKCVDGVLNGDTQNSTTKNPFKSDAAFHSKTQSRLQVHDSVEMKSLAGGKLLTNAKEPTKSFGSESSLEARNDVVSISSSHSSVIEEDGKPLRFANHKNSGSVSLASPPSCTEIHSTV